MRVITAEEMKEIDRAATRDFGIPSLILMENAGRGTAEIAANMLSVPIRLRRCEQGSWRSSSHLFSGKNKSVVCICGKGNNGGDGFVCARHLINSGIDVDIFLSGEPGHFKGDAKTNLAILEKMGASIYSLGSQETLKLKKHIEAADLIIDAIFGIGIFGQVRSPYDQIISIVNQSQVEVLAVDIPSGLDANEGICLGSCVRAATTATFAAPKKGMLKNQGPDLCGKVMVVDISIPEKLMGEKSE